ncbi:MAG: YfhO family protein [Flavobacteriaceae bacterium]|nr:YfhO family protein [Flavobacteriaceae bacterium]
MSVPIKKILPHVLMVLGFVVVSLLYFNPVLKGKQIFQSDIMQYNGMAKQQNDFRAQTGQETYWTNSAFGGMPTYQLGAHYPHNYIKMLDHTIRFLPRPADYLFLYFIGFYVLMLLLKVDFKLAAIGAIAFGFSTYLIILLGVGHNAKAHAIAYMPLVLSGILLTFRKKYIYGFLLTALAMGLELSANHFQMTYYLLILVIILGIVYLIDAVKNKELPHYFKSVGILTVAVLLSVGMNGTNILATQEYKSESTRSKSELTIHPDGSEKEITDGLSRDYITEYSYGITESFNLFIPRFMGGGTFDDVGKDSETFAFYKSLGATSAQAAKEAKQTPVYWGKQPIVEAPAYVGAVIMFLFVLALFLVKGRLKVWLLAGTIVSLLLSFGKNLPWLTDLFINVVPMYNKFRAVSSIQVILELCIPVLGIFGLVRLFDKEINTTQKLEALKWTTIITAGLCVTFLMLKNTLFDFVGIRDGQYLQAYGQAAVDAFKADRRSIFTADTFRTLGLVLVASGLIWMYLKEKLSQNIVTLGFLALIAFDLVAIDRHYVNNDDFVPAINIQKPYQANPADLEILKDDGHFRVFDMTTGNTRPNYFHNSLNGYHAAKMRRYNELFDFHIVKNNMEVLNMLNTKYIIAEDKGQVFPYVNEDANGNAWFVSKVKNVANANEEIKALDVINTKEEVIFNAPKSIKMQDFPEHFEKDSLASIQLVAYKPNYLKYNSNSTNNGFGVFSENYYGQGWQAYIDGNEVPHYRVNYVLRGMEIPAGTHTIEFKFEPEVITTGSTIALGSSIVFVLLSIGGIFWDNKKVKQSA